MVQIILRLLKSRFGMFAGIGVVFLLLIPLSRLLGLTWTEAMISVVLLLILYMGIRYLQQRNIKQKEKVFQQGMNQQSEEEMKVASVPSQQSIQALQKKWQESIAKLKTSGVGKYGHPLYFLPWYVVMGEPQSGKSTAIRNSGLEFPVGDCVQGTGGTKNCDWWFSNKLILLDTAGRYIFDADQEVDKKEWQAFLGLLNKYRRKMPINGLIFSLSVESLMTDDLETLKQNARKARQKVDELIQGLNINFPVFLLLTKSDLINGFTEFFDSLPEEKLDQLLGWSNDERKLEDPVSTFESAFDAICSRLNQLRRSLIKDVALDEQLQTVFFFPEEFERIKPRLSIFVEALFKSSAFAPTPFFRGFYFNSGTQVGTVISSIMEAIGLKSTTKTFTDSYDTKSYFLRDFFSEILMRDKNLVMQSKGKALQKWQSQFYIYTAAIGILLFLILTISFTLNLFHIWRLQDTVSAVSGIESAGGERLRDYNDTLFEIGDEIETLHTLNKNHFFRSWGLYVGNEITKPLEGFFFLKYKRHFLDPSIDLVRSELEDKQYDQFVPAFIFYIKYLNTLIGELNTRGITVAGVTTTPEEVIPGQKSESFLKRLRQWFKSDKDLVSQKTAEPSLGLGDGDFQTLTEFLRLRQLLREIHGEHIRENFYRYLAWQSQKVIEDEYNERKEYLTADLLMRFDPVSVLKWVETKSDHTNITIPDNLKETILFHTEGEINALYTKQVWNKEFHPLVSALVPLTKDPRFPEDIQQKIYEKILFPLVNTYGSQYYNEWLGFLRALVIAQPKAVIRDIPAWVSQGSLIQLLDTISENTNLQLPEDEVYAHFAKSMDEFSPIHDFISKRGEYQALLDKLLKKWNSIEFMVGDTDKLNEIKSILLTQDAMRNPFIECNQWTMNFIAEQPKKAVTDQLGYILQFPVQSINWRWVSWTALHIDGKWKAAMYPYFKEDIAGKFPFVSDNEAVKGSVAYLDLRKFQNFFAPTRGKLSEFITQEMTPFGEMLPLGKSFNRFIDQCNKISNVFFSEEGDFATLEIDFETQVCWFKASDRARTANEIFVSGNQLTIQCSRERQEALNYWNGPPVRKWWKWSLDESEQVSLVAFLSDASGDLGRLSKSFSGPWCLMHLLRNGKWNESSGTMEWRLPYPPEEGKHIGMAIVPYKLRFDHTANLLTIPFEEIACPDSILQ